MGRVGMRSTVARTACLILAGAALLAAAGCGTGRSFALGKQAAMNADWDLAVTYFEEAVKSNPGRADYKIALERSQLAAAQVHFDKARTLEQQDQLDLALLEYRKVVQFHAGNQEARAKIQLLEKTIRDRIEASRPRPPAEAMRQQARKELEETALNPTSRDPVKLNFPGPRQLQEILEFLRESTGINIAYDSAFQSKPVDVKLEGVTLEEALHQILMVNGYYYKVLNPRSIIIIPDNQQKRQFYDEQAVRTFYLSNAKPADIVTLLNTVVQAQTQGVRPTIAANEAAKSITVRGTLPMLQLIDRVIAMNDKPRADVSIDVEILEVNRGRAKQYGLELSQYSVGITMSPERRPGGTDADTSFNLNTISAGVSTADFYTSVPSAVIKFLETDSETKVLAKPNLRGTEGEKLSVNLGEEIPVPNTTFYNPYGGSGGVATTPLTSFQYKNVGVNVTIEPRVTYDGDVIMKLTVEVSQLGADINVAGQNLPSFLARKVDSVLRLRDGESNLLAGLLSERERRSLKGFPGILRLPVIKQLFSSNDQEIAQTDIVMLITPHIVRSHEMTQQDYAPVFIGTQQNLGLAGPPPLIQPAGEAAPATAAAPPAAAAAAAGGIPTTPTPTAPAGAPGVQLPQTIPSPGMIPPPAPQPPAAGAQPPAPVPVPVQPPAAATQPPAQAQAPPPAAPAGVQPPPRPQQPPVGAPATGTSQAKPPGAPPAPVGVTPPGAGTAAAAQPKPAGTQPAPTAPPVTAPTTPVTAPPATPVTTGPPGGAAPPPQAQPAAGAQAAPAGGTKPPAAPAAPETVRVMLTTPATPVMVAGGPYTVPINISGVSRASTLTLSLRFNPKVLRVRVVQEGTFMHQGGVPVSFSHQVDSSGGRVDITITRTGDTTGASGTGMLAAIVFDAVGSGESSLGLGGVVAGVGGIPMPVQFGQALITVK